MDLDYFDLLCFEPCELYGIAKVKSPTLKEIAKLNQKLKTYNTYLYYLSLDIESYYKMIFDKKIDYFKEYVKEQKQSILDKKVYYESLSLEEQKEIKYFDILIRDRLLVEQIKIILSFFIVDKIEFFDEYGCYFTFNGELNSSNKLKPTGIISRDNYEVLVKTIFKMNAIDPNKKKEENLKFKNAEAERLWKQLYENDEKIKKEKEMEALSIPNLLSALCGKRNLNIINIWDITVYQLYDQFKRVRQNNIFDITSTNVSVWGNSNNEFDLNSWYEKI